MGNVFFVVWRESLEAVLIVGILSSYLLKQGSEAEKKRTKKFLRIGIFGGVSLSACLGLVTLAIQTDAQGVMLDYFQAFMLLFSAALMTQMVFWMNKHGRKLKSQMETELKTAWNTSGLWGIAGVSAFAIAREGAETVVYLYGLSLENAGSHLLFVGMAFSGFALALLTAAIVSKGIRFLNYQVFFRVTSLILLFSAAGLLVSGINRLIAIGSVPALVDQVWNTTWLLDTKTTLGGLVASFTGYSARPSLMVLLVYFGFWVVAIYGMKKQEGSRMKNSVVQILMLVLLISGGYAPSAYALNYSELEVYPYETASKGEVELENQTHSSSGNSTEEAVSSVRSSFEANYGLTDRIELAAYADFSKPSEDGINFDALRFHGRTKFFEKNELPVDTGAYFEMEFPRHDQTTAEAEFKIILERDFGLFTLDLNPSVDRPLNGPETKFEFKYGNSLAYRLNDTWRPHLDYFGDLSTNEHLLMPAVTAKVARGLKIGAGAGFGLTAETDKRIFQTRLEYEF